MSRAQLSGVAHLVLGKPHLKLLVPSPVSRETAYICQLCNDDQTEGAEGDLTAQSQPIAA